MLFSKLRKPLFFRVLRRKPALLNGRLVMGWRKAALTGLVASGLSGCMASNDELRFIGNDREVEYYVDQATRIDYPSYAQESPRQVAQSYEPRRIRHPRKDEILDMSLEEVLRSALVNAEILLDGQQERFRLMNAPEAVASIHDVAIQETATGFGVGGVQAALSEFDATFTTNFMTGRSEQPVEAATIGHPSGGDNQHIEFGDFRSQLAKIFADGSQISLQHNWLYLGENQDPANPNTRSRLFLSHFTSSPSANQDGGLPTIGAEYRRPLLQGAGAKFTRIAGPIARRPTLQSTPTVNQGVMIARIRTDVSIADLETSVANLLHDVEAAYWDLYLAYRVYDAEMVAKESALRTWQEVRANNLADRVGAADESQARDNLYEVRARSEDALAGIYSAELQLRRLLGMPVNDGQIIRPSTEPVTAEVGIDWRMALTEALVNRPELRRQKWNLMSLELQYEAAGMLVRPRLDFVARYQVNGFGDRLFGDQSAGTDPSGNIRRDKYHGAYSTLLSGDFTGWGLGFEFSMPLGFRGAMAQVQNIEHRIAKQRAILSEQELEVSYELAQAMQSIDQAYQTAKTNFNRRRAAERRVQAFKAEYEVGRTTLDLLLRSQLSLATAENNYYRSLVSYARALNAFRRAKGTVLTDNNVFMSESMWTEEAYDDAIRRAWMRSFSFDAPDGLVETQPEEFVLGGPDTVHGDWIEDMPPEEELPIDASIPAIEALEPAPAVGPGNAADGADPIDDLDSETALRSEPTGIENDEPADSLINADDALLKPSPVEGRLDETSRDFSAPTASATDRLPVINPRPNAVRPQAEADTALFGSEINLGESRPLNEEAPVPDPRPADVTNASAIASPNVPDSFRNPFEVEKSAEPETAPATATEPVRLAPAAESENVDELAPPMPLDGGLLSEDPFAIEEERPGVLPETTQSSAGSDADLPMPNDPFLLPEFKPAANRAGAADQPASQRSDVVAPVFESETDDIRVIQKAAASDVKPSTGIQPAIEGSVAPRAEKKKSRFPKWNRFFKWSD